MHSCLEISMGSWSALCTQIHSAIIPLSYIIFVLATKQTLLSVLLANHALLETYFQDKDFQMDTHLSLRIPGEFTA